MTVFVAAQFAGCSNRDRVIPEKNRRTSVQLANLLEELGATTAQLASVSLQATQYCHVPLIQDTLAKSPNVSTASFIASLAGILSDCDDWDGWN